MILISTEVDDVCHLSSPAGKKRVLQEKFLIGQCFETH